MFEKIDKQNELKIQGIKDNIAKAENKIQELKGKITLDMDIDKYSEISVKINSYEEFIKMNREQIVQIKAHPYMYEDLIKERDAIQREYNLKFKKTYSDISSQIDKLCSSFDYYKEITGEFLKERNLLNNNAAKSGFTCNVYDAPGIKNDFYSKYETIINDLKKVIKNNKLE